MTVVALSFTSESCDHYLSLFTDIKDAEDLVSRLKEEYNEEFGYLRVDSYATDDVEQEGNLVNAVREALNKAEEDLYDIG